MKLKYRKYDDDQPRDDLGRFGSGGGGKDDAGGGQAFEDQSLSMGSRSAVNSYTGNGAHYANGYMRKPENLGQRQKAEGQVLAEKMDKVFEEVKPLDRDMQVYRGMQTWAVGVDPKDPEALVGKTIHDKGWTSTSTNRKVAQQFATSSNKNTGVIMEIKVSKGSKMLNVKKNSSHVNAKKEDEALLDRGGSFRVTGYRRQGGMHVYSVEHTSR